MQTVASDGIRVVIASRLFPPEPGAAAYRLGRLARALLDHGAGVTVLTTRPPAVTQPAPLDHRLAVRRWPVLRDKTGNVRGYVQFASFDGPLLLRLLAVRRPDAVVVEPPPTTGASVRLVTALRRIPYVYYAGDVSSSAAEGMGLHPVLLGILRRLESWAMRGAAGVLAVSEGVAAAVADLGVPHDRITVVGTGVDTDAFTPPAQVDDSAQTLVYAGTMSDLQGCEVFVRGFAAVAGEFPQARMVMLGQGTEQAALQRLADELVPGRVSFEGLVGPGRVAEALGNAWAGLASVRPGCGYDFSFPTKMFVTTSCGTPVIYSGVGPGRTMVEDNRLGWHCDWDAAAVADAMRAALRSAPEPADRQRLRAWTLEHASQGSVSEKAAATVVAAARRRR